MIQRIQSLYLALAILFNGSCFLITDYSVNSDQQFSLINYFMPLGLLLLLVIIDLLIALFLYKKRTLQISMVRFSVFGNLFFLGLFSYYLLYLKEPISLNSSSEVVWLYVVLPLFSFLMCVFALKNILKDEELVKSLDRIR